MPNINTASFRRWDYVKITVLGFATTALWQSLHGVILPQRLLDFVPEAQKNTYLGILTLCGLLLAMFVQPIAGAVSDRSSFKWGRRRPYILWGIIIAILLLPGIALAGTFAAIFIVYCLLQVTANTAQGPYQAFVPELAPPDKRGVASGVKSLFELAGGVTFVLIAGYCYTKESGIGGLWVVLGALGFVLLVTMLATVLFVREPAVPVVKQRVSPLAAISSVIKTDAWKNHNFIWFLVSRLLFYMAFTTIQQFAFYYLQDVVGVADPSAATSNFIAIAAGGMLVVVWPAGYLSDKIGRKLLTAISGVLGALGIAVIALYHEYNTILWAAGIIGVAKGIFDSTNWALAVDFATKNEEARYLGIANMATAGGAALARVIGPAIDFFNSRSALSGYNFMLIMCIVYFIAGGALVFGVRRRA
ncbi:MAG: MFS transporter [Dehalococcoidales bacterium]